MDIHENARTTRHSRMLMVQRLAAGWSVATVATALGVTARTVRKWRDRHAPLLHDYNTARPHAALAGKPPISRLTGDNLLGSDSSGRPWRRRNGSSRPSTASGPCRCGKCPSPFSTTRS